jgi:hypothetical protein
MRIALVYGNDQRPDGSLNKQTQARCEQAVRLYRRGIVERIYLTTSYDFERSGKYMLEEMHCYLLKRRVPRAHVRVYPYGSNTAGETDALLLFTGCEINRVVRIFAVSTWYHLPRIWMLWAFRGYLVSLNATAHAHVRDVLVEPLKFLHSLLRPYASAKLHDPSL